MEARRPFAVHKPLPAQYVNGVPRAISVPAKEVIFADPEQSAERGHVRFTWKSQSLVAELFRFREATEDLLGASQESR